MDLFVYAVQSPMTTGTEVDRTRWIGLTHIHTHTLTHTHTHTQLHTHTHTHTHTQLHIYIYTHINENTCNDRYIYTQGKSVLQRQTESTESDTNYQVTPLSRASQSSATSKIHKLKQLEIILLWGARINFRVHFPLHPPPSLPGSFTLSIPYLHISNSSSSSFSICPFPSSAINF